MNNKNSSNTISLMQAFDDICEKALTFSSNDTSTGLETYIGDVFYEPYKNWRYDFGYIWSTPNYIFNYNIETSTYPKTNSAILEDGTSVLEIAASGFSSDEITVRREDLKIIVEGKKEKDTKEEKKYLYKQIAERNFSVEFIGSEKWDYDKLSVNLKNGILTITIPILESCKTMNKTYKITE